MRTTQLRAWSSLLLSSALAACTAPGGSPSPASPTPSATSPTRTTAVATGTPAASPSPTQRTPGPDEFINPVLFADFPDPQLIEADGTYYAYATGPQMATSPDLVDWDGPTSFSIQDTWAIGDFWAPEVLQTSAGFVMYYTARSREFRQPRGGLGAQCLGLAVAEAPEGPFVERLDAPFVCQEELGGSIDAHPFVDADGSQYLLWKNDGNCCGIPTEIFIQPLSDDGLELTGEPSSLGVTDDELWEGSVIEAPTLWLHDGTYYLFYSANAYNTAAYAVGYATSEELMGPYEDAPENPILAASFDELQADPMLRAAGPGHQDIIEDDEGDVWMTYHAWDRSAIGYELGGMRSMWLDELLFEDGKAVVDGPDMGPQPAP